MSESTENGSEESSSTNDMFADHNAHNNMPRMSNTAEILTKQFRGATIRRDSSFEQHAAGGGGGSWSAKKILNELSNFFSANDNTDTAESEEINELFPKYLTRLQHNFFVSLLILNILFGVVVIVVSLAYKSNPDNASVILLNCTSLLVFAMFLVIAYIDEHLLRPRFSRTLTSITILVTMVFAEYGTELLQMQLELPYMLKRIRPTMYIILANHILLPFPSRLSAFLATVAIIIIEIVLSFQKHSQMCTRSIWAMLRLTTSDCLTYLYAALFGLYISRLLEISIRRAFKNHHNYIESKFNIYQEQEQQEQLLNSCFPKHLIDDVRKDLKEIIKVLDRQEKITQRPFKKLYVKKYDNVSILYADIVNSMILTSSLSPNDLVETLNDLFGRFDETAEQRNCTRIKLLGDCYYCVSGLPKFDPKHALNCINMGLDMIDTIRMVRSAKNIDVDMRIGIHSGMALSGIIGVHKWQFDIWSADSLLASAMEHDGVPGAVHVTKDTLDLVPEIVQRKFIISERHTNERVGYLINRKKMSTSLENLSEIDQTNNIKIKRHQTERLKENFYKLRRRSSFSTIRKRKSSSFVVQEFNNFQKYLEKKNKVNLFIDREIENMPLSFKNNFRNFHGINPIFLTFTNSKIIGKRDNAAVKTCEGVLNDTAAADKSPREQVAKDNKVAEEEEVDDDDDDDEDTGARQTWQLEKEFLTLNDDFFIFYLFFVPVICLVIGLIKFCLVPRFVSLTTTLISLGTSLTIIAVSIAYSYRVSMNLSLWKRTTIWFIVVVSLLICSLHDIIVYSCSIPLAEDTADGKAEMMDCPYQWCYTMCVILSMTSISIFIRINLWLKFVLRTISLIIFTATLTNRCSIYQIFFERREPADRWLGDIGFDPIFSHFYYVFMVYLILCLIDRQIEYIFRLDFKLSKRLKDEKQEAKIMAEINVILLNNILPTYVVQKYLDDTASFTDQIYSESYEFVAVMFASIPNYSEFYCENKMNDNGIKCLQLLNEIICDFDQILSQSRFHRIEKIKTIGSTYMTAAGLRPGRGSDESSTEDENANIMAMVRFAMALMQALKQMNIETFQEFKLRIGIATGPVIAGIVGASKPQYDIWGDTVNVASRMESTGVVGRIQITSETADIIQRVRATTHDEELSLEKRGPIQVKGKGNLITYLVKTKFDFEENEITYV